MPLSLLVLGAGGAGLRAALAAAQSGAEVTVMTKVPPTRSHTVAAQGGINAALGNRAEDHWRWHAHDTMEGACGIADQAAVDILCEEAPAAVAELEQMGMPFSRDAHGKIYQRAYGGQRTHLGEGGPAYRACASADRTGHALLHTLYQQCRKHGVKFLEEWLALDLLFDSHGQCCSVLAWDFANGDIVEVHARGVILATGGFGQAYAATTSSTICTGDGGGMAARAGIKLRDMEFVQFHPTGLYGSGVLVSEAARGEGAVLLNRSGERFMQRYDSRNMELSCRDVIARAIMQEIAEGRGCGLKADHVHLSLAHLDSEIITNSLPGIREIVRTFGRLDAARDLIPVLPAVHFCMGGIPTTLDCEVAPGLWAVGEAACLSVHGANRLGCNALLELVVFGKRCGEHAAEKIQHGATKPSAESRESAHERFDRIRHAHGTATPATLRKQLQFLMQTHAGILRNQSWLEEGLRKLTTLEAAFRDELGVRDSSLLWNQDLSEAVELGNLMLQSRLVLEAALNRTESRGAHWRTDFPQRDDKNWKKPSLTSK